jgi:site-specific recombinase XerC
MLEVARTHLKDELGRHFFGPHAVSDLRVDIYPVQARVGHGGTETTQRYARLRAVPIARVPGPKKPRDDT